MMTSPLISYIIISVFVSLQLLLLCRVIRQYLQCCEKVFVLFLISFFVCFCLICFVSDHQENPMKYRFYIFTFIKEKWYPNQPDIT